MSGGPLEPTDLDHRLRAAETIVREAGRVAADQFARRELLSIDRKGAQDLVSEADRVCEDLIVAGLFQLFPEDGFLGEERGSRNPKAAAIWVVDPDVWNLAPYGTAATPTSKNWQRDANSIRLLRPVLRLPSRQHGSRAFGPATPGHTELFAWQPASSPIVMRPPRPMAARTTEL
jgi:hypothetical protein